MNDSLASATYQNRVWIIGRGQVQMADAYAVIQSSFVLALVLVGHTPEKTEGEVIDLEYAVPAVSTMLNGEYGLHDVDLGTSCEVGKDGIGQVVKLALDEEERAVMHYSTEAVWDLYAHPSASVA